MKIEESIQSAVSKEDVKNKIIKFRHPDYEKNEKMWETYRDVYEGGEDFKSYIETYSDREDPKDFIKRKKVSYIPAFAKSNLNQIKNAISQRIWEIIRKNGPTSYTAAMNGDKWGVDMLGNSMNAFINKNILGDLLSVAKVGVFIDSPQLSDTPSLMETIGKRPYLYTYQAEDILAWTPDDSNEPNEFSCLLLRDNYVDIDDETGLPLGMKKKYRFLRKKIDGIHILFYDEDGIPCDKFGNDVPAAPYIIKLPVIPFVVFEINQSLLADVYSYQIALLNLASSDMNYILKSNFPFYVEQYDPKTDFTPLKTANSAKNPIDGVIPFNSKKTNSPSANLGVNTGRRYPIGADAPKFVHPSPEPLQVSMAKEDQLKSEIKELLMVTLANITAGSVEIQNQDRRQNLEAGLNNIGLELQYGEKRIAKIWALYENDKESEVVLTYPKNYNLKTEVERRLEAKETNELKTCIPSKTFQKEIAKEVAVIMLQGKVSESILDTIKNEVDNAKTLTSDAKEIQIDQLGGLVGDELASEARGYPPGQVDIAKADHAARIARIQAAQSADTMSARGVKDNSANPQGGKQEKALSSTDQGGLKVDNSRGPGQ